MNDQKKQSKHAGIAVRTKARAGEVCTKCDSLNGTEIRKACKKNCTALPITAP